MPQEYHIELQQDAMPVVHPPHKVSFSLYGKLIITELPRWINPLTGWIALW